MSTDKLVLSAEKSMNRPQGGSLAKTDRVNTLGRIESVRARLNQQEGSSLDETDLVDTSGYIWEVQARLV